MWLMLTCLVAGAAEPAPAPPDLASVVQRVEARYRDVTTLKAAFVQTTRSAVYGEERQAGTLWLERPNHMRWSFTQDGTESKLFLADGGHLWITSPLDRQVMKTVQVEGAGGADVLLTSLAHLSEQFVPTLLEAPAGQTRLSLAPREPEAMFKTIEVGLDAQLGLSRLILTDPSGAVTDLVFTDVKLGEKLEPSLFQIVVPDGWTVVDLGG